MSRKVHARYVIEAACDRRDNIANFFVLLRWSECLLFVVILA